jgi:L-ascorbate 6-phosphate lactonase
MNNLENILCAKLWNKEQLMICWLGGAGFILKTSTIAVGIDLYLSNACMKKDGTFKRLTPPVVAPENLTLNYLLSSHEHGDHLDTDSIGKLIHSKNTTRLVCPSNTMRLAASLGVSMDRICVLDRGEAHDFGEIIIHAVMADHGNKAPDAVGFIVKAAGKSIYFLGDSRFRTDFIQKIGHIGPIDVLLVPINGRFGNPDARDAAYFVQMLKPKLTIPCHFWLFKEHGGDPGEFTECCGRIAPDSEIKVLAIGETCVI